MKERYPTASKSVFMRLIVACLLALVMSAASAAPVKPVVVATATAYTYVPGNNDTPQSVLIVPQGATLDFFNADVLGAHSITSATFDGNGLPIFDSDAVNGGQAGEVRGIDALPKGTYPFFCTVHSWIMKGTLQIT